MENGCIFIVSSYLFKQRTNLFIKIKNITYPFKKMALLKFSDIKFTDDKEKVILTFLRLFETEIDAETLKQIGPFKVKDSALEFPKVSQEQALEEFMPLLDEAFKHLKNKMTGRKTIYVHKNSSIPLLGTLYFGIVDRGTNILELKPITGCNINCPFCSVDEQNSGKKPVDFVVEDDYLVAETGRLVKFKQEDGKEVKIDIFINTHGEPLLYSNMARLVKGLRAIKQVNIISIITNGTMLSDKLTDELVDAGLNQINISINATNPTTARILAGTPAYDIEHVIESTKYAASKIKVIIAPVWIKGVNDDDVKSIIALSKEIGAEIGIQNYMVHKMGRKLAKQVDWEAFYKQLEQWEKETGMQLRKQDHTLFKTKTLEKPFDKGDVIKADIVCQGRMKNEMLAVAKERVISVINSTKQSGTVKIRILRDKDNTFVAEEV